MIEFKGECGHLIKARDDDVGKVVRCPYCGKDSCVVRPEADDLGGLLGEMERTGEYDKRATRSLRKEHRAKKKAAAVEAGATDPVDVIKKMIYIAVAVIVIAVAWSQAVKIIRKLPDTNERFSHLSGGGTEATPTPTPTPQNRLGLLTTRLDAAQQGVFVTSIPAGCDVYVVSDWDTRSSIVRAAGADFNARTDTALRLPVARHFVAVAVRLNRADLMKLPGYPELRRRIERDDYTNADLESYFVRDGSIATRVDRRGGSRCLVRVFDVRVDARSWRQVTALFLPDEPLSRMVTRLPKRVAYGFNVDDVRRELTFYQVDRKDHDAIIEALRRIGSVVYAPGGGASARSFRIDPDSGALTSVELAP